MDLGFGERQRLGRQAELTPDRFCDLPERHAFLGHAVESLAPAAPLQREAIHARRSPNGACFTGA